MDEIVLESSADSSNPTEFSSFLSEASRGKPSAQTVKRVAEAANFIAELRNRDADYASWKMREAMSTADFPTLFSKIIEDDLVQNYTNSQPVWSQIARRIVLRQPGVDAQRRDYLGGVAVEEIPEAGQYPVAGASSEAWSIKVGKYGQRFNITLEMILRDVFDVLDELPERLAISARHWEERKVMELLFGTSGLNATTFSVGNANILSGNPALTRDNLNAAITQLRGQNDRNGDPIEIEAVNLIVPRGLRSKAQEVMGAISYTVIDDAGNETRISGNGVDADLNLVVAPFTGQLINTNAATTWIVAASPTNGRAPLYAGLLRGHEEPRVLEANSNARQIGGGLDVVSFDDDTHAYKLRGFFGAAAPYPNLLVGSNGSGS